ncbi:hypothetical protein GOP47_0001418 [Adiantum capillus-veneris]|uniref:Uncharacterized protein n=1 Tax=Adiantum capillus-veneris TaxID=13818 RepID=A0A9D4V879_ADICA|nr:hypothetical protein GOP47_0001418 [Adiantum capillus-veneris]
MPPPEQQPLMPHPLSGDTISPAYIHTVQHLIEKCMLFKLDQEECITALEKHAKVKPVVTRIVWNELEKANPDFFIAYNLQRLDIPMSIGDPLNKVVAEDTTNIATSPYPR